jgi:hypothetical protein
MNRPQAQGHVDDKICSSSESRVPITIAGMGGKPREGDRLPANVHES